MPYLLVAAICAADVWVRRHMVVSGLYALPVLFALWLGRPRDARRLCILATLLALWGVPWSELGSSALAAASLAEQAVGVFLVWTCAALGRMRLAVEDELSRSRDFVSKALQGIGEAVIATDRAGRVRVFNPAAERLTGWDRADALGLPLDSILILEPLPSAPEGRSPAAPPSAALVRRDGVRLPVDLTRSEVSAVGQDGSGGGPREPEEGDESEPGPVVVVMRDASERLRRAAPIEELAWSDPLTGLANRAALFDRLRLELAHARRARRGLALLFVDLDDFKRVNDTFGHAAGDALLCGVAQRLRGALREGDTIARLAGDEFVVLLPGIDDERQATSVALKCAEAIEQPIVHGGSALRCTASIGVALHPQGGDTAEELLRQADLAMYRVKQSRGAASPTPSLARASWEG